MTRTPQVMYGRWTHVGGSVLDSPRLLIDRALFSTALIFLCLFDFSHALSTSTFSFLLPVMTLFSNWVTRASGMTRLCFIPSIGRTPIGGFD